MAEQKIRICFDMDGVIADGTVERVYSDAAGWAYGNCTPIKSTIRAMCELQAQGVEIYIHTARWEEDRPVTERWLVDHKVPFDAVSFGKPHADLYVDDKNYPLGYVPQESLAFAHGNEVRHILEHARHHRGKRR